MVHIDQSIDLLGLIVEFSIGLAGFSGIAGAFIHRTGEWPVVDRFRVSNLLFLSLTPGFLAFIALGLLRSGMTIDAAARTSAALFSIAVIVMFNIFPRNRARVPEHDRHIVGLPIFLPMSALLALVLVSQLLVAAGIVISQPFVAFYFGLVALLLGAVVQFARLILVRPTGR